MARLHPTSIYDWFAFPPPFTAHCDIPIGGKKGKKSLLTVSSYLHKYPIKKINMGSKKTTTNKTKTTTMRP